MTIKVKITITDKEYISLLKILDKNSTIDNAEVNDLIDSIIKSRRFDQ